MARILIVDDEPTILELFKYIFEEAGHEVATAKNGRLALSAVSESVPDFIVLDISMPEMSGKEFMVELLRLAKDDPRLENLPFVVMTGENFMEDELSRIFASAPGFVCFFPKMTPPEIVCAKAEEILNDPAR